MNPLKKLPIFFSVFILFTTSSQAEIKTYQESERQNNELLAKIAMLEKENQRKNKSSVLFQP